MRRGFPDAEALRQLTHRHLGRHLRAALSWEASVEAGPSSLPLLLRLVSGHSRRSGLHVVLSAAAGNAAGLSPEVRSPGPRTSQGRGGGGVPLGGRSPRAAAMALKMVKGSIDRMFDKNLQDLVRGIRNHKEDEVSRRGAGLPGFSPLAAVERPPTPSPFPSCLFRSCGSARSILPLASVYPRQLKTDAVQNGSGVWSVVTGATPWASRLSTWSSRCPEA